MDIEQFFKQLDHYFSLNQIKEAEQYLETSLHEAKESEDYSSYLSIGNEMIGFYRSVSRFDKAFDIAEDVLLLMEELGLGTSEHFATTLLNAATAYRAAGNTEQAYRYYGEALQIYERLIPEQDYRFAGLYNNMSILKEETGANEEAAELLRKALIIVKNLPDCKQETAVTLTNMGLLFFKMNKEEEALESLEEALEIFDSCNTKENTDAHYSAVLAGIGEAFFRKKEYAKALEFYTKALDDVEKHFGRNQSFAVLCENCAAVCECMEDKENVIRYRKLAQLQHANKGAGQS